MDPTVDVVLRVSLALLLLEAAAHKARDLGRFRATLAAYRVLPAAWTSPAATSVVAAELATAGALVGPVPRALGSVAAAVLLLVYAAAIGANLSRGRRHIDCGCSGRAAHQPISGRLVLRNLALGAVALATALPLHVRATTWVDTVTMIAATTALAALWAARDRLVPGVAAAAGPRGTA